MNTAQRLTPLTLLFATFAAAVLVHGATPAPQVVQLEPVHMTAQRLPSVQAAVVVLPAVEITSRRAGSDAGVFARQRPGVAPGRNVNPA